jgi:hypothetical protein
MRSRGKKETKQRASEVPVPEEAEGESVQAGRSLVRSPSAGLKDEWLVRYEVNDNGVGHILLPPSLSVLLQSDRVSITPSAGGIFIRSV